MEIYAYFGASLAIWQLSVVLCCRNHVSTLATIVAAFGDNLSPKTATVAENGDSCRIRRQSPFSATVAVFGDNVDRALEKLIMV